MHVLIQVGLSEVSFGPCQGPGKLPAVPVFIWLYSSGQAGRFSLTLYQQKLHLQLTTVNSCTLCLVAESEIETACVMVCQQEISTGLLVKVLCGEKTVVSQDIEVKIN